MANMKRRVFLTTAAATPLLATKASTTTTPDTPTKIQRLYSELKQQANATDNAYRKASSLIRNCGLTGKSLMKYDSEISNVAYQEQEKKLGIATKVMNANATCQNDVLIKSIVTFEENECGFAINPDVAAKMKVEAEAFLTHENSVGAASIEPATDPIIPAVKQWFEVTEAWVASEENCPEANRLWDERADLAIEICKTEAVTLKGLLAQFKYFRNDLGYLFEGEAHKDYAIVTTTIQSGLENLAV